MVRALLLSYEYAPRVYGGLGRAVSQLAPALGPHGAAVTVAALHAPGAPSCEIRDGVAVRRVEGVPAVGEIGDWRAAIDAFDTALPEAAAHAAAHADVIHAHDWFVAGTALGLRAATGLPLVVTVHATERGRHQGWLPSAGSHAVDAVEQRLATAADVVVVCSHWMRRRVLEQWGVDAGRVEVVPHGAPAAAVRPAAGARRGVLFAGRLEHEKGGQVLLHALARLAAQGLSVPVTIAGDGSQRAAWGALAERLGVDPAVSFVGRLPVEALDEAYAAAAVVVVPSLYEPFGLVAVEAMAAGAPVVASDTGGLAEVVRDGGLLVAPDDDVALAAALHAVLTEPDTAARLAASARRRSAALPSWDTVAGAHLAVYRRAIRERREGWDG